MTKIRGFEVVSSYKDKGINLPARQTKNAAGYDFEASDSVVIPSMMKQYKDLLKLGVVSSILNYDSKHMVIKPTLVHTGIKAYMQEDEYLAMANRSSNPIKRNLILTNGVGIIDSDYYNNKGNEGEIMFQFINFGPKDVMICKGDRIGQGIFQKFLLTDTDVPGVERTGGHGSTDKQ